MFVARQPKDAARRFLDTLGRITECVTAQRLFVLPEGYGEPGVLYVVAFGPAGEPVKLRAKSGGQCGFMLDVRQWYVIVEDERTPSRPAWRVTTKAYEYRILDSQESELLVFHWQPGREFKGPDFPHLHVSAALAVMTDALMSRRLALNKLHVPTGLVTLESVVRLLISEFGVDWRVRRWESRLKPTESKPL